MLFSHTKVSGHISLTQSRKITLEVSPLKGGESPHIILEGDMLSVGSIKQ